MRISAAGWNIFCETTSTAVSVAASWARSIAGSAATPFAAPISPSFWRAGWMALTRKKIPLPFAPDIAVEVLSPSETALDANRKVLEYLAAGSREVWQLDHENGEIFIRTEAGIRLLHGADAVLESPLLPGFSAPLPKVLAGF